MVELPKGFCSTTSLFRFQQLGSYLEKSKTMYLVWILLCTGSLSAFANVAPAHAKRANLVANVDEPERGSQQTRKADPRRAVREQPATEREARRILRVAVMPILAQQPAEIHTANNARSIVHDDVTNGFEHDQHGRNNRQQQRSVAPPPRLDMLASLARRPCSVTRKHDHHRTSQRHRNNVPVSTCCAGRAGCPSTYEGNDDRWPASCANEGRDRQDKNRNTQQ